MAVVAIAAKTSSGCDQMTEPELVVCSVSVGGSDVPGLDVSTDGVGEMTGAEPVGVLVGVGLGATLGVAVGVGVGVGSGGNVAVGVGEAVAVGVGVGVDDVTSQSSGPSAR